MLNWIKNKLFNNKNIVKENKTKIELPEHFYWNGEQLYCRICYPSHTVPFTYFFGANSFFEDDNVKMFINEHSHPEDRRNWKKDFEEKEINQMPDWR